MKVVRILVAGLILAALSACATQHHTQITQLSRPGQEVRILLLPVDVELSELAAGGTTEVNAAWTRAAKSHISAALAAELTPLGARLVTCSLDDRRAAAEHLHELQALHGVVGQAIALHQYVQPAKLPTKDGKLQWSLGPSVSALREQCQADYALFLHIRDSYSSGGRVAMIAMAAMFGVSIPGGIQVGYSSLVDLSTGDVVWFNRLLRGEGDLRTPGPAAETTRLLLSGMPK